MVHPRQQNEDSVESLITLALQREQEILAFYESAIHEVGYDAANVFAELAAGTHARINRLLQLLSDIKDFRLLSGGMAD